jgi:ABC-type Mn2+/Zn2+ transport system ATPase subunit
LIHNCERGAFPETISFSLETGELLAFIGPNGVGKSTTIKMLTSISVVVDLDTIFSFERGARHFPKPHPVSSIE